MSNQEILQLQQGLRSAKDEVLSAIEGTTEGEARRVPAPGEWTVTQLLAHIAEIQGFWVGKAVRITQENDLQISRTDVENDLRLAAVTDHSQDSLDDLKRSVISACEEAVAAVGNIDPKDLSRPGRRESNPMTAGDVIHAGPSRLGARWLSISMTHGQKGPILSVPAVPPVWDESPYEAQRRQQRLFVLTPVAMLTGFVFGSLTYELFGVPAIVWGPLCSLGGFGVAYVVAQLETSCESGRRWTSAGGRSSWTSLPTRWWERYWWAAWVARSVGTR